MFEKLKAKFFGSINDGEKYDKPSMKKDGVDNSEISIGKTSLHKVYNKKKEFIPLGQNNGNISQEKQEEQIKSTQAQFGRILNEPLIDLASLKDKSWKGIPSPFRGMVWKILLGYHPASREQAKEQIKKMRSEYKELFEHYYQNEQVTQNFSKSELNMIRVVKTDAPRTQPTYEIFKAPPIQEIIIRILTIWGLRHPACGYVQGMNEILSPLLVVFLNQYITVDAKSQFGIPHDFSQKMDSETLFEIEADAYWCLGRILDKIQDNYTCGQPGIKKRLDKIEQIINLSDSELSAHLKDERIEYVQFAFRWMLCLLIREFPLGQSCRIMDTFFADDHGITVLQVYMCAALILKYAKKLLQMRFNEIMLFLQNIPTDNWSENDIEILLSEAFVYMSLYEKTQGHIKPTANLNWV